MKSAQLMLGMLVILIMCSQAQASVATTSPVLDFEVAGLTQDILNSSYGSEYGVSFSGWGLSDDANNEAQINRGRMSSGVASISFNPSQYSLVSID